MPFRTFVKTVFLTVCIFCAVLSAYNQGIQHAIDTASVWAEGESFMVSFDGEVHEYR